MKVTITGASPHPSGLRLGVRIEHKKAGWIRFSGTVLVVETLTEDQKRSLVAALDKARYRSREHLDDASEPLF